MDPVLIIFLLAGSYLSIYFLLKKLNGYKSDDVGYRINPVYRSSKISILLIVDDYNYEFRELIARHLEKCGFDLIRAMDGFGWDLEIERYQDLLLEYSPDLIIIDGDYPYIQKLTYWRVINLERKYKRVSNIPILLLIFAPTLYLDTLGLKPDLDKIIFDSFSLEELYVRIKVFLRKTNNENLDEILNYGPLTLVPEKNQAIWQKSSATLDVLLNDLEFELLHCLLQSHGKTLSRAQIFKAVWGYDEPDGIKNVSVLVGGLRKKIENDSSKPKYLKTVYGKGYCLLLD